MHQYPVHCDTIYTAVYSTQGLCSLHQNSFSTVESREVPVKQDKEGRLVEECCCVQPLRAEQNQAFLMEVFILCSMVWSILTGSVSIFKMSLSAACSSNRHNHLQIQKQLFTHSDQFFRPICEKIHLKHSYSRKEKMHNIFVNI